MSIIPTTAARHGSDKARDLIVSELQILQQNRSKTQAIHEFLEYVADEHGYELMRHEPAGWHSTEDGRFLTNEEALAEGIELNDPEWRRTGEFYHNDVGSDSAKLRQFLYEFIGVDPDKLEEERRSLVEKSCIS